MKFIFIFILLLFFFHANPQNITFNAVSTSHNVLFNSSSKCPWNENLLKRKHCAGSYVSYWFIGGGVTTVVISGLALFLDGANPYSSAPLTKSQNAIAMVDVCGIGIALLGLSLDYASHKYELRNWQKFSLIGNDNQIGVAYNFR